MSQQYTYIKNKFSKLLRLYRSLPTIFFILYITLTFLVIMMFSISSQLNVIDCDLLLCNYTDIIIPIMNIVAMITFMPSLFILTFNISSVIIILMLFLLTLIYWQLLSYLITVIYCKIKKIPLFLEDRVNEKFRIDFSIDLTMYFNFLLLIFITIVSILFYPKTDLDMGLLDFISISSFIIAISGFLINFLKDENIPDKINKSIRTIFMIMILFLFTGFYATFLTQTSINKTTSFSYAVLNGIQIGILQMQIFSIMSIFSIYITHLKIKKTEEE